MHFSLALDAFFVRFRSAARKQTGQLSQLPGTQRKGTGLLMTFQQLIFAVSVAKCASINKAAEQLYTHQSNVSNTLKQLEEELGIEIFQRTKKGVLVTNEGREFLNYAEDIIGRKSFVENLYAARHRDRKQYLRISSMRAYFLSTPMIHMQDTLTQPDFPPTYIRLEKRSFSDVLDDVENGRSDLGIVFIPRSQRRRMPRIASAKSLNYTELGESVISAVMREDHPAAEARSLEQITRYPYLIAEETENFDVFYDQRSESVTHLFEKPPNLVISCNESATLQDIAAHSDNFFLSCTPWKHSQHYSFTSFPLEGEGNTLVHYYVTRRNHTTSALLQEFLTELTTMF